MPLLLKSALFKIVLPVSCPGNFMREVCPLNIRLHLPHKMSVLFGAVTDLYSTIKVEQYFADI
jgi:hypothetical protein